MVQRSNDARLQGAQIIQSKEECVGGMGQRSNNAVVKDAQIILTREECVGGMGQIARHTTYLLRLDQNKPVGFTLLLRSVHEGGDRPLSGNC